MNLSESEILKYAMQNGIIDIGTIQDKIEMNERKKYLEMHPYSIWQGKNGKWYTYLPDEKKGRISKKLSTRKAIEDTIVEHYKANSEENKQKEKAKKITLYEIFPEWINYKKIHTDSTSYIKRITADWKRFYSSEDELIHTPLCKLTKMYLDNWAHEMIKKHELTKKSYYNMTIILRQCLDFAVELHYIQENVFAEVKINTKLFKRVKKKTGENEVYNKFEEETLIHDMIRRFNNNPKSTAPLAVIFAFETGVRIGELCALKITDIEGNYIHIQRQEVRDYEKIDEYSMKFKGFRIVDYAKTDDGYRYVYLTNTAKKIIDLSLRMNEINGEENPHGFLFCKDGMNVNHYSIQSMIFNGCYISDMKIKTSHKIRKTYISTLIDSGLNIDEIRRTAGHSDERTTYGNYCFNRLTNKQTEEVIENALCDKEVIKGNQLSNVIHFQQSRLKQGIV